MDNAFTPEQASALIFHLTDKARESSEKIDKEYLYGLVNTLCGGLAKQFEETGVRMPKSMNLNLNSPGAIAGERNVSAGNTIIQTWEKVQNDFDLPTLANELGALIPLLREANRTETKEEYEDAIVAVRNAEKAAKESDGQGMMSYLLPVANILFGFLGKMAGSAIAPTVTQLIAAHLSS